MKILFFNPYITCPTGGGVERVISEMYRFLTGSGHLIFTAYYRNTENVCDPIPDQMRLPEETGDSDANRHALTRLIEKENFDLAINFGAMYGTGSRAFVEAAAQTGLRVISVYHNTLDWVLWDHPRVRPLMMRKLLRTPLRMLLGLAQKLPGRHNAHYTSRHSEACVLLGECYFSQFRRLIDRKTKRLRAIHNPLSLDPGADSFERLKDRKENVVLFVGRLTAQKNIHALLRAWKEACREGWRLEIVGDGPEKESLMSLAENLGISDSVSFEGHRNNPEDYYRRARIFAMTSIFEGYPMTLIECQAFGCVPVITDSYPAASEIVDDGRNGRLSGPEKFSGTLRELLADGNAIDRMAREAMGESRKYSVPEIAAKWNGLIHEICSSDDNRRQE